MTQVEQKIIQATYQCSDKRPVIAINSQCRVYLSDDKDLCLEYYPAGGIIAKICTKTAENIVYQRGFNGRDFSQTEMKYIKAFFELKNEFYLKGGKLVNETGFIKVERR